MNQITDKKELRTLPLTELRVSNEGGPPVIEGHAAVFDNWSETLGCFFPFKEKVRRGAFRKSITEDDIRALFNHDPNYVLGRNRSGTLNLREDEKGLLVSIHPPDTQWARDLTTSIQRGDINQMSFGFVVIADEWSEENGIDVRELIEVQLFDVSPVTFPAYTQTDIGVRAVQSYEQFQGTKKAIADEAERSRQKSKDFSKLQRLKNKFKNL